MKLRKLLVPIVTGLLAQTLVSQAGDLYLVNLRATCKVLAADDRIVTRSLNNSTILRDFATAQDPQLDPRTLRLVYDEDGDRIVITDTSGNFLGDVLGFGFSTVVANSTETQRERHVFVFRPGLSDAAGSGTLTEKITRNNEGVTTRRTTQGRFSYGVPASDIAGAEVCSGTFSLGRKLVIVP